ncbi:hypothetical protein I0C86_41400 [Plantactinospora sp. S1510]|uniref:Uncharacterized protein n=1 Tax=Plantactinospora alkalitolerans TaxID=2789879 RepID=A0ABS0HAX5_9ACTN|nr:hypothetical protein [Plantactinospora alkalitolerans]MBF9135309.1 hypothetical protein [Plantactinospora alkalitolerans]
MIYSDKPYGPRIRLPLRRRQPGAQPEQNYEMVWAVMKEFPEHDVDQVLEEARQRGATFTREFVQAAMQV